jgi:RES domain-containing protein
VTLIERLAHVQAVPFRGPAYRQQSPGYDPRSGAGARQSGGRFNPPQSFPVLYLGTSIPTLAAELARAAAKIGLAVDDVLPREVFRYDVDLDIVLDLRAAEVLALLEVSLDEVLAEDRATSIAIGEEALAAGWQGIWCPSATGDGDVLAILLPNLGGGQLEATLIDVWQAARHVQSAQT